MQIKNDSIRDDGTITNYIQQLDKLFKTNENFDEAKELVDSYGPVSGSWFDPVRP
ncbi:hypothetical protein IR152_06385 [Clostridioides sp. ES-S-0108-01]|uniref:hypothetical protein n=1 Tax=Clostridioides sp. ES-S-0108-01 TaxID=2770773 RepID=UPI001D0C8458|nr:hypothetical protein [Clostridioides sp. ES-S-0108-01]UDN50597.1 hypothetical protein JJC16_14740 [Clostridioides sp. ES-S-0107-01]